MSKILTKEDVISNKKDAIKSLNKLLEYYINDTTNDRLKKADLISYWIKDYVRLINFEDKFIPTKNISYKRGNIVKVDFGFNIGSEYGGRHYAVILDIENAHHSPVVTVIPLTSTKENKTVHSNSVHLGNELYRSLRLKYATVSKALDDEFRELLKMLETISSLSEMISKTIQELGGNSSANSETYDLELNKAKASIEHLNELSEEYKAKYEANVQKQADLNKIKDEILKMKEGSIALVNQITTISKMRIVDPRTSSGVLYGVSLSAEGMDKINQKVKELYVF